MIYIYNRFILPGYKKGSTTKFNGFRSAKYVQEQCLVNNNNYVKNSKNGTWLERMTLIPQLSTLYCPVEKVGTTFWRRFIYQLKEKSRFRHPFEINIERALGQKFQRPTNESRVEQFDNHFKFAFVRNPYHRVLSAYVDKVFAPNPMFWERFGKPAIELSRGNKAPACFHDATFQEFVRFVVRALQTKTSDDPHFNIASEMCQPCLLNFNFIGTFFSQTCD